jgi:hypothetical protein
MFRLDKMTPFFVLFTSVSASRLVQTVKAFFRFPFVGWAYLHAPRRDHYRPCAAYAALQWAHPLSHRSPVA